MLLSKMALKNRAKGGSRPLCRHQASKCNYGPNHRRGRPATHHRPWTNRSASPLLGKELKSPDASRQLKVQDDFVGAINALKPLLRRADEVKKPTGDDEDEAAN
jgi:hypothetical protein